MISLKNITLQQGLKILIADANISFHHGQKIGIVGKNGCGKTSLFALLLGKLESTVGEVVVTNKNHIAVVEQESPDTEKSIIEYVIDADQKLRDCQNLLQQAEENHDGEKLAELYEEILKLDGFTAEARAAIILKGLGFSEQQLLSAVNSLSGGWKMRVNIARALFVPSQVLLLDEPTNHLDLDAVIWLEKWLQKYNGLLLIISHDQEFLDKICTNIAHIEQQKITLYKGNYSTFEAVRAESLVLQQKQYEKQQQQIAHLQSFIDRFKAKATKARQAQARVKAIEKMTKVLPVYIDSPFTFEFKDPDLIANPLITLHKVSFAYDENIILNNIDFQLNSYDRIGLLGKNGAGKSTFIKLLAGELNPSSGKIIKNGKLKIGYFSQHTPDLLDLNKTPIDHIKNIAADNISELELRKFLGSFNFSQDLAITKISKLSGGEKARLSLALIVYQRPNILLLDEPTNHMDMELRQAVSMEIQSFAGAVVTISHDRYWLKQIVDYYYLVDNKKVEKFSDDLDSYYQWLLQKDSDSPKIKKSLNINNSVINNKKKQLQKIEKDLLKLKNELSKIDEKLLTLSQQSSVKLNNSEILELNSNREIINNKITDLEEQWLVIYDFLDKI